MYICTYIVYIKEYFRVINRHFKSTNCTFALKLHLKIRNWLMKIYKIENLIFRLKKWSK